MTVLAASAVLLLADGSNGHHGWDWGGGWWVVMGLGMIVFWALVIVGAVWVARSLPWGERRTETRSSSATLEILERRLASGEIEIREYQRLKAALLGRDDQGAEPGGESR